jgi:hypothetical protein
MHSIGKQGRMLGRHLHLGKRLFCPAIVPQSPFGDAKKHRVRSHVKC